MTRASALFSVSLLACTVARAAPPATTAISVSATGSLTTASVSGPATFTNGIPSGTFKATVSPTNLSGSTVTVPFTITSAAGTDVLSGSITLPTSLILAGGSGTGSATTTSGTGAYAGDTYSFPNLAGTGSLSGTNVTITFSGTGTLTTGSGTGTGTAPVITHVWDAASNTNSLAPGSIFIVQGTNLCPSGTTFYNVPRPTVGTDGVKITFTPSGGGTTTDALLWYEYNPSGTCQLAGILPSTVTTGNYTVTVTNGSTSAAFATTVVTHKLTLFTQDSTGSGLASVQNYISSSRVDLNSYTTGTGKGTTISPAHPGQFLLAYGTGMGALVGGDNVASPSYDFSTNGVTVQAIVGGMTIPVAYAGRAGYAGEDQINIALPNNVPTGCTVSFQISVNGALSNTTFIAIAPDANSTACVAPGFTTSQLQNLDNGGSFTSGGFSLLNYTETVPTLGTVKYGAASGAFIKYSGYQLLAYTSSNVNTITQGACSLTTTTSGPGTVVATGQSTSLDAGAVTISGPSGSNLNNTPLTETNNAYSVIIGTSLGIPNAINGSIVAGTYTLNGAGGKDVGKFSASVTVGSPLNATLPTSVSRSSPLTLTWTGGNASDLLEIVGSSGTSSGTTITSTTFICTTTAGAGTFTVPVSILSQMLATSTAGSLVIASGAQASFSAPLTAGGTIDAGYFFGFSGIAGTPTYQ